jgi:hypothetical protein
MPQRIQLSRRKGWKMPPNTVKVDRTTKWGNPCIVGKHGTLEECVKWFSFAVQGTFVLGMKNTDGTWLTDSLMAYHKMAKRDLVQLRGKNLACWCPPNAPCHADILLEMANANYPPQPSGTQSGTPQASGNR